MTKKDFRRRRRRRHCGDEECECVRLGQSVRERPVCFPLINKLPFPVPAVIRRNGPELLIPRLFKYNFVQSWELWVYATCNGKCVCVECVQPGSPIFSVPVLTFPESHSRLSSLHRMYLLQSVPRTVPHSESNGFKLPANPWGRVRKGN